MPDSEAIRRWNERYLASRMGWSASDLEAYRQYARAQADDAKTKRDD